MYGFISYRMINSCKLDCPGRSPSCHASCEEYRRARAEADAIAAKAMEKHTGARALRAILEEYMLDIMYEIPKDDNIGQVTITREYIEGNGGPKILLRGQEVPLLEGNH